MAMQTAPERTGSVTFQGNPMTLVGTELHPGDRAPEFTLVTKDMKAFTLDEALGNGTKTALLIVVPSLDTPTCSLETQTFHKRLSELPKDVVAYIVSLDLPFAQQRWAGANEAVQLTYLSDYREHQFGAAYGVLIKELGLLARSTFVIRPDRSLAYTTIVKEIGDERDYEEVFSSLKD